MRSGSRSRRYNRGPWVVSHRPLSVAKSGIAGGILARDYHAPKNQVNRDRAASPVTRVTRVGVRPAITGAGPPRRSGLGRPRLRLESEQRGDHGSRFDPERELVYKIRRSGRGVVCLRAPRRPSFAHSSVAQWQSIRLLTGGL